MYKLLFLLIFIVESLFVSAQIENTGAYYCSQRKIAKQFRKQEKANEEIKHTFDVLHYSITIDLFANYTSPYPKSFTASCKIKLVVDSSLNTIVLDASNYSLIISSVSAPAVAFTHNNNKLNITLNQTYNQTDTIELLINYQHKNIIDGAFYVSNGFVFTDCEPQGARKWFPCYDRPSDKATFRLQAKTPLGVLLGSNGKLLSNNVIGDSIFYVWQSSDPIATYLMVITSKMNYNLDIIHWKNPLNQNDSFPIWFYYNNGEDITYSKNVILQITNCFSEKFGPHPFEKNGFATLNSDFLWGGMENQTLTSLCPGCWIEVLLVHEYAHQWFGDMITCATWADLWLNEGFATYCEAIWDEYQSNYTTYHNNILAKANYYLNNNPGWPVYNASWAINPPQNDTLFDGSITYYKGSCVLHMLRYMLGDALFFNVLHSYATDLVNFRYKSVTTRDFMDKVNAVTGQNYDWFFQQWIFQPNHPIYANYYAFNEVTPGEWLVTFTAKQTQTNTVFFKMPIEILISFKDNSDTLIRVMNDTNNQSFAFTFNKQPKSLAFDPNKNIVLKKGNTVALPNIQQNSNDVFKISLISNPISKRDAKIAFKSSKTINCNIKIIDNFGKNYGYIYSGFINKGLNTLSIPFTNVKSGMYYLIIENDDGFCIEKMAIIE